MRKTFLKSKPKADPIVVIGAKVEAINNLINLKAISVADDNPDVHLYIELWGGKDKTYKNNWCKNLLMFWKLNSKKSPEETRDVTMGLFNKETGDLIGTYTDKGGFVGH